MGLAEILSEKWEALLEWSDEKGLPLRGISESLEEKGIPAMPFFVFLLLLIIGGALYFALGQTTIGLFEPRDADVVLMLRDSTGKPIANADITLHSEEQSNQKQTTNSEGQAKFERLLIGGFFTVSAIDSEGQALDLDDDSGEFNVFKDTSSYDLSLSAPIIDTRLRIQVTVKGPEVAETVSVKLSRLEDGSYWTEGKQNGLTPIFTDLMPNTDYLVTADAPGFSPGNQTVRLKDAEQAIIITLLPQSTSNEATLHVLVQDAATNAPLKDVVVEVLDESTNVKQITLKTGENGYVEPQTFRKGKTFKLVASLKGYQTSSESVAIGNLNEIKIEMDKIPEAELKSIRVSVTDQNGNALINPIVKLYDDRNTKLAEQNPAEGAALFNNVGPDSYYVTAFKSGYLPTLLKSASRGNTYSIQLEAASSTNSGKLRVQVENQNEEAVSLAAVALLDEEGYQIGVPDKISGNDGIASFEELPLASIYAVASANGRKGTSDIIELTVAGNSDEENLNFLKITMTPAKGRAAVTVKDHFTGKVIDNAKVEFSLSDFEFLPVASCITKNGRCTANIQEGFYVAAISAGKYDLFTSSEFEIKPNTDNKLNFPLISSDIAAKTRVAFGGVFNLDGDEVNSLSPSTIYVARFTITRPSIKITKAELQVRLGSIATPLEREDAEIVGFEAGDAVVSSSDKAEADVRTASSIDEEESPTAEASPSTQLASELPTDAFKVVHFDFAPFEGSREVSVQFRTRAISEGKVDLNYRSAFFTDREVLRDPIDNNAPTGAFIANTLQKSFPISFEGVCENGICVQANFEGRGGTTDNNYESQISETFKLNFKLVAPKGTVIELSAPAADQTIALTEGVSGNSKAVLKQTEDMQILALTASDENAQGSFTLQARRLANDVGLTLLISNAENILEKSLFLRIVGEKPDLKVSYNVIVDKGGGKTIKALKENKLVFTVTDSLDLPLKNAFVTIGSGADALGGNIVEAELQEAKDGTLTYVAENVNPPSVGSVKYKVSAEGFKPKSGTIPVQATTLISLDTKSISLTTSEEEAVQEPFSIQNLLANQVKVSYSIISPSPKYTDLELELVSASVPSSESLQNSLSARFSDSILKISSSPQNLKEKISGKIHITAKLGSTTQEEDVPFVVNSNFRQQDLNKLWSISSDAADFALQPPETKTAIETITIANEGPETILINHQSSLSNVYMEPLSQPIEPGATAEFTITARSISQDACRFEDDKKAGKIDFFASTNGVISKKSVTSEVLTSSSENCVLKEGLRVSLPITFTASLPKDTKIKYNNDGSILIQLPSGERFLFDSGATVTKSSDLYASSYNTAVFPAVSASGNVIVVPPGVFIEASPNYVKQSTLVEPIAYSGHNYNSLSSYYQTFASSSYTLTFPFSTYLDFDSETEFSQIGGQKIASIEDFDVYFPASAPLIKGANVKERRANLPANSPITIQLTPFINSQQSREVTFPTDATFVIQERIRIRNDDFSGSKAIQLPSGTTITLPADATFSSDASAAGGSGDLTNEIRRVTIPAGSILRMPAPFVIEGDYGMQRVVLPFKVQFKVPKGDRVTLNLDADGVGAKSISTEIYEVVLNPISTRVGFELADGSRMVEVVPSAPITIRPTDFGVVGITKKLPVPITIYLSSADSLKKKGNLRQIEFANGQRMLLEGVEEREGAFGAKELAIPSGTPITFSANYQPPMAIIEKSAYGTESFTITIPQKTVYHFPLANAMLVPPNAVENTVTGYKAEFGSGKILFERNDEYNDVVLTPQESMAGVRFSGIDPALDGLDFEFRFSFPMTVQIPGAVFQAPRLEPYKQKSKEIMSSFRLLEPDEVKMVDSEYNDEFTFTGTRILAGRYESSTVDFNSDPKTFVAPTDTLLVPRIKKAQDGKFWMDAKFTSEVSISLPSGLNAYDEKEHIADLGDCQYVEIKVRNREYGLPNIRAIKFPQNSRLLAATDASEFEDGYQQILVNKNEQISLQLCPGKPRKDKGAAVEDAVRAMVAFEYDKAKPIDINDNIIELDFNDGNSDGTQEAFICVQNHGFSVLNVEFRLDDNPFSSERHLNYLDEGYVGDSVSGPLDGALKSAIKPIAWETTPQMLLKPVEISRQSCERQSFKLEIGVPSQYLDQDGCIEEEYKDFQTDPKDTFITLFGTYNGKTTSQQIGVKINLKKYSGGAGCKGSVAQQFREMLGNVFVNYADDDQLRNARDKEQRMKLFFKGPTENHERAFAIINNLDESISVTIKGDGLNYVKFKQNFKPVLAPGDGQLISLQATKAGKGELDILAIGADSKKEFKRFVSLEVFPLEQSLAQVYASTPLGELAPQPATGDASLSPENDGKSTMTQAPAEKSPIILFADPQSEASASDASTGSKPTLPTAVMGCQTNFCSSSQVEAAFQGFAQTYRDVMNRVGGGNDEKFMSEISRFCDRLGVEKVYTKSIVIQAANARTDLDAKHFEDLIRLNVFQEELRISDRAFQIKVTGDTIDGCGIYIVRGRFDGCKTMPGNKEEWLRTASLEFKITNSYPCAETVANAPLLLSERVNVEPVIGRVPAGGLELSAADREDSGAPGGLVGALQYVQFINIGPYKEAANVEDLEAVNAYYQSFYGEARNEPVSVAEPYEDKAYCSTRFAGIMAATQAAGVMTTGLIMASGVAESVSVIGGVTGAWKIAMGAKAAFGLASTAALCTVGASNLIITGTSFCTWGNDCIAGGVAGVGESLLSAVPISGSGSAAQILLNKFKNELVQNLVAVGLIDAGIFGYNVVFDDDLPVYAPTPLVYGAAKFRRTWGTQAYLTDYLIRGGMGRSDAIAASKSLVTELSPKGGGLAAAKALGFDDENKLLSKINKNLKEGEKMTLDQLNAMQSHDEMLQLLPDEDMLAAYRAVNPNEEAIYKQYRTIINDLKKKENLLATKQLTYQNYGGILSPSTAKLNDEIEALKVEIDDLTPIKNDVLSDMRRNLEINLEMGGENPKILFENMKKPKEESKLVKTLKDLKDEKRITPEQYNDLIAKQKALNDGNLAKIKKKLGGEFSSLEKHKKALSVVQMLLPLLFHIDIRPVEGALDYRYPHHIVVFGNRDGGDSMTRICVRSGDGADECVNELDAGALCDPSANSACIYMVKGTQFSTQQGYSIISGFNAGLDSPRLIESLFIASTKPLTSKEITPSRVKVEYLDTVNALPGGGTAITPIETDPRTLATQTYESLMKSCSVTGYCPGDLTESKLQEIQKKIETDPKGAMAEMLKLSRIK